MPPVRNIFCRVCVACRVVCRVSRALDRWVSAMCVSCVLLSLRHAAYLCHGALLWLGESIEHVVTQLAHTHAVYAHNRRLRVVC